MKSYKLFFSALDSKLKNKAKLRVDLIGDMKISEIKELEDFINTKGALVQRKVRYIQIFKKEGV